MGGEFALDGPGRISLLLVVRSDLIPFSCYLEEMQEQETRNVPSV
jgi:hypothetical protein